MGVNASELEKYEETKVSRDLKSLSNKNVILFIGRLSEIKGVSVLLEAYSRIKSKDSVLVVAGDGPDRENLVALSKELGIQDKTHFTGYVHSDEKNFLLKIAKILVIPSIKDSRGHTEGMPVVLMEGLASGKIIIASDKSSAETVITHKKDGYIYASQSVDQLSRLIKEVLSLNNSNGSVMENNARNTAKQFDWQMIAKKHYDFLFKDVLAESK